MPEEGYRRENRASVRGEKATKVVQEERSRSRNEFVAPDEPMAMGTVRAIEGAAELPGEKNEYEAEREPEKGDLKGGDRRGAREDNTVAFVLEGRLLPLEVGEQDVGLVSTGVIHLADGLDLGANLRKAVLEVDEALHRLLEFLVNMRNVGIECTVNALSVVLQSGRRCVQECREQDAHSSFPWLQQGDCGWHASC